MRSGRRGDRDRVEVVAGQQLGEVAGVLDAEVVRSRLSAVQVLVPHGDELGVGVGLRALRVIRGVHMPEPEHRDPDGAVGYAPWHFLYFLPDPHQHGSLRPSCSCSSTRRCSTTVPPEDGASSSSSPYALGWSSAVPPE